MPDSRTHDVVLFGATGFVGALTAAELAGRARPGVRVALAGRSRERLERVRAGLPAAAGDWPLVVADSSDAAALADLARSARVVVSTVGPYARHGLPLVEACAAAGTHYADLTGEVLFVRRSIDAADAAARRTGARIVHSCGFDSIPSDLGMLLTHLAAAQAGDGTFTDATLAVLSMRGGASGGTIDSLRTQVVEMREDRAARRLALDPYALSPDRDAEPSLGLQRDAAGVRRDELLGGWTAPFVMASYNTRIVRRSNALLGWAYGRELRYREVTSLGSSPLAPVGGLALTAGLGALVGGLALRPTRAVLDRVLPSPGDGPSENARRNGRFAVDVHARTAAGAHWVTRVAAQGDPGYAATSVMLAESALSLAEDGDRLPDAAGVLTPATALGEPLAARLRTAGMTLTTRRG